MSDAVRTIRQGGECMKLHENGEISRPSRSSGPSGQWKITGAVELDNFGNTIRNWTLAEILADPRVIPWKHKNGAQRVHLTDLDHGMHRIWASPCGHEVR
jgi:hypothetical protein